MNPLFYIIPSWLSDTQDSSTIPPVVFSTLRELKYLFVETAKETRRFLKFLDIPPQSYEMIEFQKDLPSAKENLKRLHIENASVALLSDAGVPAVGDPGYEIVREAHSLNFTVSPLPGSSSIILGLMSSGLLGQQFCFHGYTPHGKDGNSPENALRKIFKEHTGYTHIFIETPYSNQRAFTLFTKILSDSDSLSIAQDILGIHQNIRTQSIGSWKKTELAFKKIPSIFVVKCL